MWYKEDTVGPLLFTTSVVITILSHLRDKKKKKCYENKKICFLDERSLVKKKCVDLRVLKGKEALEKLLSNAKYPCSPLSDPELFYKWALDTIEKKSSSFIINEFQKRQQILELEYKYKEDIDQAKETEAKATQAWENHPDFQKHASLSEQLKAISNVVEKMREQLAKPHSTEKLKSLTCKIQEKEILQTRLQQDLESMNDIIEYISYCNANDAHEKVLMDSGIRAIETELSQVSRDTGVRKSAGGFSFEKEAAKIIEDELLMKIALDHHIPVKSLIIVRNITFKMVSFEGSPGEIDMLVCHKMSAGRGEAKQCEVGDNGKNGKKKKSKICEKDNIKNIYFDAKVLAVIEVKKNCDDIGKSFLSYQSALTWLAGLEELYDANNWKSNYYTKGHFEKPFVHELPSEDKDIVENLVFTRQSFEYIKGNRVSLDISAVHKELQEGKLEKQCSYGKRNYFCKDLYYVTKFSCVENLNSRDLNVLIYKLSKNKDIYNTRRLLKLATSEDERKQLTELLQQNIDEIRVDMIRHVKCSNFCAGDLLRVLKNNECFDQIFMVDEKV